MMTICAWVQGPCLFVLFTLMLAASDREAWRQRHETLEVLPGLRKVMTETQAAMYDVKNHLELLQLANDEDFKYLRRWVAWERKRAAGRGFEVFE